MRDFQYNDEAIEAAVSILKSSRRVLFITGAGLSADSGLPTYRGVSGLYNRKLTEEGMTIEEAISGQTLRSRPEIAWKYIYQIEEACRGATFNRGHEVIAAMEKAFDQVWVLTQNIDGFHWAAGTRNLIDIHGDIHRLRCTRCDYRAKVADYSELERIPPYCPKCEELVRPEVVFFGELLPQEKCLTLYRELERGFDVIFTVGTSSVFPYIAQPVIEASRIGAETVEINPDETEVSGCVSVKIRAGASETLGAIWEGVSENR